MRRRRHASEPRLASPAGRETAIDLMTASPAPTALIVADNRRAIGALRAIHDRGLDIPRDLSLVALSGDVDALALHNPPITIVDRPLEDIRMEAAKLLLASLASGGCDRPPGDAHVRWPPAAPRIDRYTELLPGLSAP